VTVIVAVVELAEPTGLVTRTQNLAVAVRAGVVRVFAVAPGIGVVVFPLVPRYHWYLSTGVPDAVALSVAVVPEGMV
jgi:hypothetical protein